MILAEDATSLHEQRSLYEQGMIAGERAIGPDAFVEHSGHFWGLIETRPYMRARLGLALTLYALGDRPQAIDHLKDLLRLNPMDNQGVRYMLLSFLLEESRDDEADELLAVVAYSEDVGAHWTYGKALAIFRKQGRSTAADEALVEARRFNQHVPLFLLEHKRLPHMPADVLIELGGEAEAVACVLDQGRAWRETSGALEWLSSLRPRGLRARNAKGGPPGPPRRELAIS